MTDEAAPVPGPEAERVPLRVIAAQWGRLGCIGFGGPPAHIALLRKLVVDDRAWLDPGEFEDGVAAVNLLPGPASTQLAIYCAWRLRTATSISPQPISTNTSQGPTRAADAPPASR